MYYHNIYHIKSIFILEMGDGGDRPMGETAPNAVLSGGGGNRPQRGFIWRVIEKVVAGYREARKLFVIP